MPGACSSWTFATCMGRRSRLSSRGLKKVGALESDMSVQPAQCTPGASPAVVTETISPGATRRYKYLHQNLVLTCLRACRIVIPLMRINLPPKETSKPIPSLLERQFVVTRSDLTADQEMLQRELFWHREALLKCLKAHWREASGRRTGLLDLRRQRLSHPMLEALRSSNLLTQFSVTDKPNLSHQDLRWSHRKAEAHPNIFSYLRIKVINVSRKSNRLLRGQLIKNSYSRIIAFMAFTDA